MKQAITFAKLETEILKSNAKSEYKQASIVMIRDIFKALKKGSFKEDKKQ